MIGYRLPPHDLSLLGDNRFTQVSNPAIATMRLLHA
jgi:hypothetical protein